MAQNNQINVPTPFAVNKGGTGVTSVTTAPTASAWAGWDANKNFSAVGFIPGYSTTVTSSTPVVLTVGSNQQQYFTGSTAQTLTMPVANTCVVGQYWTIVNNSSAVVTIQSSGANTILALPASSETVVTCVTASGTGASSWTTSPAVSGSGTVNSGTINQLAWYAATGTAVSGLATANNGVLVTSNSGVPSISSNLPAGINLPSPFSVNTTSVTSTGTQLNLLNALTVVPINKVVVQVFTGSGTYTPTTGMVYCVIECVGGGGAGGSTASAASINCYGGGGGGGAYGRKYVTAATIGGSQTVTIGAAGSPGAAGNHAGGNGGATSVGVICTANGGTGGGGGTGNTSGGAGGAGGTTGTGDVVIAGMPGGPGGISASANVIYPSSYGGNSHYGWGGQAQLGTSTAAGNPGTGYGGGGGGGVVDNGGTQQAGGAGTAGIVIITEFLSA